MSRFRPRPLIRTSRQCFLARKLLARLSGGKRTGLETVVLQRNGTPSAGAESEPFRYKAFISYSHKDKAWGDWLHKALEGYRVPKRLVGSDGRDGPVPARLFPIFRDREELPSSADLGEQITTSLEQSAYLIAICSPHSARSRWVNEEILSFKRMGRERRILALIVNGEPNAANDPGQAERECFPSALRFALGDDGELSTRP